MRNLQDMSIGQRIILTAVIVIVILLLLAAFGYFTGRWEEASAATASRKSIVDDIPIEKDEAHILALDREALDKAYRDHIGLVFSVWMKDPNDPDAPRRAGQGARNARKGYAISRDRIEEREQKLKESKQ
jgi:hypothetical protein